VFITKFIYSVQDIYLSMNIL